MTVLTIRERDQLQIGGSGAGLSAAEADALYGLKAILPPGAFSWERTAIRVGPYCGVLRAGDLTLEILPKVSTKPEADADARGVLIAMLRSAGELSRTAVGSAPLELQRFHLLDVFIIDFCQRVNELLRRGAIRAYESHEENLVSARGRIHLTEDVRRNLFNRSHLFCRYDELSTDNPYNQTLKATLSSLLGHASHAEAKGAVNDLLRRMEDISTRISNKSIASLTFNRLTRPWRPVFEWAAHFLRGLYPDVRAGRIDNVCLLFDMERLFEAFVGVQIRRGWRDSGARVVLQGPRQYFAHSTTGPVFEMRPDATVMIESRHPERIYDAKWKKLDIAAPNAGVTRDDIYQMASYANGYRCRHVSLVYPSSDNVAAGLVESFEISDSYASLVDVFALDLQALVLGAPLPNGLGPESTSIR